jgi:H+/Cl- antiporter ClcA
MQNNRTLGIVATIVTALLCGCVSIFTCVWGFLIASRQPIDLTSNGITAQQTLSPTIGYVLLCLTVLMLLVPVAVGFLTLRKKPEPAGSTIVDANLE